MHTDETLPIFDETTKDLGSKFRDFVRNTCPSFNTHELKREMDSRKRRQEKKAKEKQGSSDATPMAPPAVDRQPKMFSLRTYKFHALGDYPATIRRFGTTDSFSTERVSNFNSVFRAVSTYMQVHRGNSSIVHRSLDLNGQIAGAS
jgi:hypothetical protein